MPFRRRRVKIGRLSREAKLLFKGILSTDHPVQVHIVPMRRCNLSCTYCNEFDDVSKPVPLDVMLARIDKLAALGTTLVTISGGEPLLHPELDEIIARIRGHNILSGMITNGYLLTAERIARLNRAGLDHMQISIDNVQPDEVSKKSLKVLDKKLLLLREHADFHLNVNSVLGSGVKDPQDALTIANRAHELGFTSTVGIIHDGEGQLKSLSPEELAVYDKIKDLDKSHYSQLNAFQENIAHGRPNTWRCRSGARYLYVCEDGLVHYCSQQRGYPAKPLLDYTLEDIRREFLTDKPCAPNCTVSCAHQTSVMDYWRSPQTLTLAQSRKLARAQSKPQNEVLVQVE